MPTNFFIAISDLSISNLAHLDIPKEKTASTVGFFACAFAGIFVLLYDIEKSYVNARMPEKS